MSPPSVASTRAPAYPTDHDREDEGPGSQLPSFMRTAPSAEGHKVPAIAAICSVVPMSGRRHSLPLLEASVVDVEVPLVQGGAYGIKCSNQ